MMVSVRHSGGHRDLMPAALDRWRRKRTEHVYVVAPQNRGWVLDGIATEIARSDHRGRSSISYCDGPLPVAHSFFFSHYSLFITHHDEPAVRRARTVVFYTHPSEPALLDPGVVRVLRRAGAIVSMSSQHRLSLIEAGLNPSQVHVLIPGVDPQRYSFHERGGGAIGFSSSFYDRKSPEVILEICRALPERSFRLLGRNWPRWNRFQDLASLPNFEYVELHTTDYPSFYSTLDVFVSPSRLEGGPMPLLESMMANVVPVASETGFAADLIRHGENGYVFDVDDGCTHIVELIERALKATFDVRATVVDHAPEPFHRSVRELMT
jgi:glycosyltransferase involved in cell wall biosynthesis